MHFFLNVALKKTVKIEIIIFSFFFFLIFLVDREILSEDLLIKIGSKLRLLLSEIKHRGAFEQAEVGLSALCRALWDCPVTSLQQLPSEWLTEILEEIVRPADQQTLKLTSTRRSAGLPFLVQAIITTQVTSGYGSSSLILNRTMTVLLDIIGKREVELESRLHALNIMRALFQNSQLGEFVFPFISKGEFLPIFSIIIFFLVYFFLFNIFLLPISLDFLADFS